MLFCSRTPLLLEQRFLRALLTLPYSPVARPHDQRRDRGRAGEGRRDHPAAVDYVAQRVVQGEPPGPATARPAAARPRVAAYS